jgi:hypothetical protein
MAKADASKFQGDFPAAFISLDSELAWFKIRTTPFTADLNGVVHFIYSVFLFAVLFGSKLCS